MFPRLPSRGAYLPASEFVSDLAYVTVICNGSQIFIYDHEAAVNGLVGKGNLDAHYQV